MRGRDYWAGMLLLAAIPASSMAGDGSHVTGFKLKSFRAGRSASEKLQPIDASRIKLPARIIGEDDRGIIEIVDAAQTHWWIAKRNAETDAASEEKKGPCVGGQGYGVRGIRQC